MTKNLLTSGRKNYKKLLSERQEFINKCEIPIHLLLDKQGYMPEDYYHMAVADYVMGKRDTMPTQSQFKINIPKRDLGKLTNEEERKSTPTLKGLFSKSRETDKTPADQSRIIHGSGITKRVSERADRNHGLQQTIATTKEAEIKEEDHHDFEHVKDDLEKIILDEYQSAALNGLLREKYACLIGAAGTGKTTVTRRLVAMLEKNVPIIDLNKTRTEKDQIKYETDEQKQQNMSVAICFAAFTGRAVQQMKRVLPPTYYPVCNTIHATLGYMPFYEERQDKKTGEWRTVMIFRPTFTAENKLPYKICIIDEAGMVPGPLWDELIAALPDDCRIILIGDINQLPPVQGRSVLGFAMTKWPTFALEKIHRQAEGNPIIANAHKILEGKFPEMDRNSFVIYDQMPDGSTGALKKSLGFIKKLHSLDKFDPFKDAFIVPQNKGTIGQVHINEYLVQYFNPEKKVNNVVINKRTVITAGYIHVPYAVGDKVMLLQNDRRRRLTNGMMGEVINIVPNGAFRGERSAHAAISMEKFDQAVDLTDLDQHMAGPDDINIKEDEEDESQRPASHIMTVKFYGADAGQEVDFHTAGQFKQITHSYAFTCHKSQGGEYPTVVILCHYSNWRMLTREWLYTAVTRAQQRIILLCNDRGLLQALKTQRIKGKNIEEKKQEFIRLEEENPDTFIPFLPQPEHV